MFSTVAMASKLCGRFLMASLIRSFRKLHKVPVLNKNDHFAQNGISGLYSPNGYQSAWQEYQNYLTKNLTLKTNGTLHETRSPFQIILLTSKNNLEQSIFHFASQAHNNHLFFDMLTDKESSAQTKPSHFLLERLADENINGLRDFKDAIIAAAESLTGQGWVFLVERSDKAVKIMASNNDGTPYYFGKSQTLDLSKGISEETYELYDEIKQRARNRELDFTLPLLVLNVWDTAYVADYGINGKTEYLKNVIDCIDWDVVNLRIFQL